MDIKQEKSLSMQDITISSFTEEDLNSFIEIHIENLFSDSEFSNIYLAERFKYLLLNEDAVTVSAKNNAGEMLGLVYGGPEGYKNNMNKHIMKKIVWSLLRKPYLLFGREFIYKYKSALNRLTLKLKPSSTKNQVIMNSSKTQYSPPSPILRLTGIAVLEEFLHLGIGEKLLIGYEIAAKERNYKSIILETPDTNIRAIKFYEKFGWKNYVSENANMGKVYFYKLIS
ncbi:MULTISPECIES: GNAT family N-acetyltransferase [unclassified Sedimentibacter]|uniref:GNAT family N-acetyltransferase n=1 Tax=unclassified Sedimentibacter TaxID=2649220 RepID=UPI0027E20A48|nr:GNAT family N-acetyltransferase [Sedimentibacter sp. MB35-C1]WMJ78076.1 GNAT family N-acetyltransferase [Sedimentibacter sp. MB35-C1]